jgi:hypothetical protein
MEKFIMEKILYIVAVFLMTFWFIGVIGYSVGGPIHVLLVMATISLVAEILSNPKKVTIKFPKVLYKKVRKV